MKPKRLLVPVLLVAALTGCVQQSREVSPEQAQAETLREQRDAHRARAQNDKFAQDELATFKPGGVAYPRNN